MQENISCTLCGSKSIRYLLVVKNYKIIKCNICSMVFVYPLPGRSSLKKIYSKTYFKQSDAFIGYKNYQQMYEVLKQEAERKLHYIEKNIKPPVSLLDVGAGLGVFANEAKKRNFDVVVTDISKYAVDYIQRKYRVKGSDSDLNLSLKVNDKFDVVTAWDVFEHLTNPRKAFELVNKALVDEGLFFLTTPNYESVDSRILGSHWYGFKKIPEHLQFFSPKSIKRFAEEANFKVIEIKTWGFVRDIGFIAEKIKLYNRLVGSVLESIFKFSKLQNKSVYIPLIDMMVFLQKKPV